MTGYQGWAGTTVQRKAGYGGKGADPLDNRPYTYAVNANQNSYQLMALMEGSTVALDFPGVTTAYAGLYDTRNASLR